MPEIKPARGAQSRNSLVNDPELNGSIDNLEDEAPAPPVADPLEDFPSRPRRKKKAAPVKQRTDGPDAPAEPLSKDEAFWDRTTGKDEAYWERHAIYLYRTRPTVESTRKTNYISIHQQNTDIEDVRKLHGGGGFKAILKDRISGDKVCPDFYFDIEGAPIYMKHEKVMDAPADTAPPVAAPAPPAQGQQDVAALVREIAQIMKSDRQPADQLADSIKLMQSASAGALEIVKAQVMDQNKNAGRDPISEQLMKAAIDNLMKPKDSMADTLLLMERIQKLTGKADREERDNPTGEMGVLRSLIGEESMSDLVVRAIRGEGKNAGGGGWQEIAAHALGKFADNLPQIISGVKDLIAQQMQIAMMRGVPPQQRPAQPQLIAPAAGRGPQPVAATPITQAQPAPTQPAAQAPTQDEMNVNIQRILSSIVESFEQGDAGDFAALVLMRSFPELVPVLLSQPMFADDNSVMEFAKAHPLLQEISGDDEFPGFAGDFIKKLRDPEWQPDDEEGEGKGPARLVTLPAKTATEAKPEGNQPA